MVCLLPQRVNASGEGKKTIEHPHRQTLHGLALVWGEQPVMVQGFAQTDEMIQLTVEAACEAGTVSWGDVILITAGIPFGGRGKTNFLQVQPVGGLGEI